MYTTITFPSLGIELNPPKSFALGPLTIHFYGVIIACGLLLAALYVMRRCKEFGIKEDDFLDGLLWIAPVSVLCARLYYCIVEWENGGYDQDFWSVFAIWKGGLAILGAVAGAGVCVTIHARIKRIKLPALLDLVALGFLIGQFMGRWGNFFNREAFGSATDNFLRMGLFNTETGQVEYHHPTFLYESVWNFTGFLLLHFLSKKRQYDGQIALGYAAWYGLGRMCIEGLRTDSMYVGPFRINQIAAGAACLAASALLIWLATKKHNKEDLFVNQVAAAEAANQAAKQPAKKHRK